MPDNVIQFSLELGVDGKKDPRSVPLGALKQAQNVVYDRLGAVNKRPGNVGQGSVTAVPSSLAYNSGIIPAAIPPQPAGMFSLGNEQVIASGNRIYCYAPTSAAHVSKDEIPEAVGTRRPIAGSSVSTQVFSPDVCQTSDGYRVYAWMTGSGGVGDVWFRVIDAATGAVVYTTPTIANAAISSAVTCLRLVACGTFAILLFSGNTGSNLWAIRIQPALLGAAGGVSATTSVFNNTSASAVYEAFDVVASQDGLSFFFAIQNASGGVQLVQVKASGMTVLQSATIGAATTTTAVALCNNAGTICLAYNQSGSSAVSVYGALEGTLSVFAYAYVVGMIGGMTSIEWMGLCTYGAGANVLLAGSGYPTTMLAIGLGTSGGMGSTLRSSVATSYLMPASRPVTINGRCYALLMYVSPTNTQHTYFWCDLEIAIQSPATGSTPRAVATIAPRLGALNTSAPSFCSSVVVGTGPQAGLVWVPGAIVEGGGSIALRGGLNGVVPQARLWEITINYQHAARAMAGPIGRSVAVGSSYYDGVDVTELGFLTYPEGFTGSAVGGGGAITTGAVYQYMAINEWTSSSNEIVRSTCIASATSQALSVTMSGGHTAVSLAFPNTLPLTAKTDAENGNRSPPTIGLYRTQANGTTFNFLASLAIGTTSYTDLIADTTIATNPLLYFTPGFPGTVLDYVCPPSSSCTFTAQGRIWILGDDLRTWWPSNASVEGTQPQFNEGLCVLVPEDGTAGGALDEKIILFSRNSIFFTNGSGPSPTGSGDFWPTPARIQSDVGCIDPRSVVAIPDGLMFLSAKGLCVLGRDLSVNFLTAPNDLLAPMTGVTSAVLFPERNEVRIALNNGENGIVLVASYWAPTSQGQPYVYRWSFFATYDSVQGAVGNGFACMSFGAVYITGSYRWVSSFGNPFAEDTTGTTYLDGGTGSANWVQMLVETSDISPNGPVGWHRVKRAAIVGEWYSPHDLYLGVSTNEIGSYLPPSGQVRHFDSKSGDQIQIESYTVHVVNQKNQSFRLMVYDAPPTGGVDTIGRGRGFALAAFAVTMQPKSGLGKLIDTTRNA
jgi:hypothetical protein